MKAYLKREWNDVSVESAKKCSKMYGNYDASEEGLLVYCPDARVEGEDRYISVRLVVPDIIQTDLLHYCHTSLEGGHQGIGRTYQCIRR